MQATALGLSFYEVVKGLGVSFTVRSNDFYERITFCLCYLIDFGDSTILGRGLIYMSPFPMYLSM